MKMTDPFDLSFKGPYICKTPGMTLWVALHLVEGKMFDGRMARPRKVPAPPFSEANCKCRDCRWARIFKGK